MSKKIRIEHMRLKDCRDKMLAATDFSSLIARGIQHIAIGLDRLHQYNAIEAAGKLTEIDDLPLDFLEYVRLIAVCPGCKSIIPLKFTRKYQFLNAALVYLLKNGLISKDAVRVPTIEEILKAMDEEGMWLEFDINCQHCGFEDFAFIHERNRLDTAEVPKLTT